MLLCAASLLLEALQVHSYILSKLHRYFLLLLCVTQFNMICMCRPLAQKEYIRDSSKHRAPLCVQTEHIKNYIHRARHRARCQSVYLLLLCQISSTRYQVYDSLKHIHTRVGQEERSCVGGNLYPRSTYLHSRPPTISTRTHRSIIRVSSDTLIIN